MTTSNVSDIVSKTEHFVRDYMSRYDASHDYSHVQRVLRHAKFIARNETSTSYDQLAITLAALLHDIGDSKYLRPGEDGSTLAKEFLLSVQAPQYLAEKVQQIVNAVSYSGEMRDSVRVANVLARHPELGAVQDADRLDAIGAVGIGRCFTYRGAKGGMSLDTAISHFNEKLLRLQSMMKTETGRQMASQKTDRLIMFRDWFITEAQGEEDNMIWTI